MASRNGNSNQLHRSGNSVLTNNPGLLPDFNRTGNAVPLSASYLQPPMSSGFAPPLPMRRTTPSSYGGRMGMNSFYSPYSRYPTSMYTPGYGGYRGYGGMGSDESSSSFIQMAEESTRPAFESIESVVEVVSSISMMLESTYHAVHSSYSAILGVVDQFSRLKDHLAQMLSILALLRGLRWLCLKVLYILKLRKDNPSDEAAWGAAAEAASGLPSLPPLPDKDRGSAWPFLMFVGLVIGAPWLMFKLLSKTVKKNPLETRVFRDDQGRLIVVTAAYDFKATRRDELSFTAGEQLYISPKSTRSSPTGWLFACNQKHETGLIPSTYLHKSKSSPKNNSQTQSFQQVPQPGFKVLGRLVPGPQPNNQVPQPGYQVLGNQVLGSQPGNQVPSAVSGNQVSGVHTGNQASSSQPGNQVSSSQQPCESFEDLINGAQTFNEAFDQPNNSDLLRNSSENSSSPPNNISSEIPSGTLNPQIDSGNYSDDLNKIATLQSTLDNVKVSSEGIKDDKVPHEVLKKNNTDTS